MYRAGRSALNRLTKFGFGRIFVKSYEDAATVVAIIENLDEKGARHLTEGLVTVFDEYPRLEYTGDLSGLDLNRLYAECWVRGIRVMVIDNGKDPCLRNPLKQEGDDLMRLDIE